MSKSSEKITLHHIINCFQKNLPHYIEDPQRLAADFKDFEKIHLLLTSQYFIDAMDMRKRSLEYDKNLKLANSHCQSLSQAIQLSILRGNRKFAYGIHTLSSTSSIPRQPRSKILTEIKLKYLQSVDIEEEDWEQLFDEEQGMLILKDEKEDYQIKITLSLLDDHPQLVWNIRDVLMRGHHHSQLFNFFMEFITWFKNGKSPAEWEPLFLSQLMKALRNLPAILMFLNLRATKKKNTVIDKQSIRYKQMGADGQQLIISWKFQIYEKLEEPCVILSINQNQVLNLCFRGQSLVGTVFLAQPVKVELRTKNPIYIGSYDFLEDLSQKIYKYLLIIKKSSLMYQSLKIPDFKIFICLMGQKWTSNDTILNEGEQSAVSVQGVWAKVDLEGGILCQIQSDLKISCFNSERGFMGQLLTTKGVQIIDLIHHLKFKKRLIHLNRQFQFKIHQMTSKFIQAKLFFIYEFKAYRFSEHNRTFKLNKSEEQILHISNEFNDNFIINARISANFQKAYFSSYKFIEGPASDREITDQFLPRAWKQYRQIAKGGKFEWQRVCDCISYICKYYMVERTFHRRMTDEQKKMTIYHFK